MRNAICSPIAADSEILKYRASTDLCTGTLNGVQLVHSDGRAVVKVCHPRRVDAIRRRYIKPEYYSYLYL